MNLNLHWVDKLPTDYHGWEKVSKSTSQLILHTANNVCTTCSYSDMMPWNWQRWIYISCQNPKSPYWSHTHNALDWCKEHVLLDNT